MPGKPKTNPWLIAIAVMMTTFMEVMDTSIAAVAVPYIAGSTASTTDEAEWVLTVYLVANAAFLLASNYFAERFGRKRYLMFSVAIFTLASFFCGLSPTLGFILLARIVQGAAGGALQPLSQAILLDAFPPAQQGMALGVFALGVVLAPVIGAGLLYAGLNGTDVFLRELDSNDKLPFLDGTQIGQVRFALIGLFLVRLAAFRPQGIFGSKEEMALDDR